MAAYNSCKEGENNELDRMCRELYGEDARAMKLEEVKRALYSENSNTQISEASFGTILGSKAEYSYFLNSFRTVMSNHGYEVTYVATIKTGEIFSDVVDAEYPNCIPDPKGYGLRPVIPLTQVHVAGTQIFSTCSVPEYLESFEDTPPRS